MTSLEETQGNKERKIDRRYKEAQDDKLTDESRSDAARTLQRTYRGHRARRELKGLALTPSARWSEVSRPAQAQEDLFRLFLTFRFLGHQRGEVPGPDHTSAVLQQNPDFRLV